MEQIRITVCAYLKNAHKLKKPNYYARIKHGDKVRDVPLHTSSKDVAEAWVRLRRSEIQKYNDYVLAGETPPPYLLDKVLSEPRMVRDVPLLVRDAFDGWEAALRRTGHRPATIDCYTRAFRNCMDFAKPLSEVNEQYLNEALRKHDALKSNTRKHYTVTLREWVKFCVKEYGMRRELIDCFTFVKVQQEERGFWTMPQIRKMIDCIECKDKAVTDCYKAWCWLMATTGARQGESALLEWSDIRGRTITFRAETTKSNKSRTVPMPIGVAELIGKLPKESKMVFHYLGRTQASRYSVVARAVEKAGIPKGSLHTLRHSASMYLYSKIGDIKLVSQILGHSPAVALQYYSKTREVDSVSNAVDLAYEEENLLPSSMESLMEEGFI